MPEPHLVLGAGAFSRGIVRELLARGQSVRVLSRSAADLGPDVEVRVGDARSLGTLLEAAKGVTSIVHGACPTLSRWETELGPITDAVVEAAGLTGATLVMPGPTWSIRPVPGVPLPPTLFDPDMLDQIIPLGRQRQWIELQVQQLSEMRNIRAVLLRSSDWFGPHVRRGLLAESLASVARGGPLLWYTDLDVPHDLVFVDDAVRVAADALLATGRPLFEVLHVTGHFLDARGLAGALGSVTGRSVPIKRVTSVNLALRGLLDAEARAWRRVLPIWDAALQLDDRPTRELGFAPTPLPDALRAALGSAPGTARG